MQDIHDIHPPVDVGIDPVIFQAAAAAAALIILIVLAFFAYKRLTRRRKEGPKDQLLLPEPPPPFEQAMQAMKALDERPFTDLRLFYFELTAILKRYIGREYEARVPEMTSQEFGRFLSGLNLPRPVVDDLGQLMDASDHVKYAGSVPVRQMIEQDLSKGKGIIRGISEQLKSQIEEAHV
ncbi:MAG: DUF4381 family protein [Desulfobacteraceae bacterium]|nr:MAG: DUF4381 family protein [Desulfobacteraceae bacterium]